MYDQTQARGKETVSKGGEHEKQYHIFHIFCTRISHKIHKETEKCLLMIIKKAKKLRGKEEEPLLTLCSSFLVNAGGVGLALLCVCSSSSSTTQRRVHSTEVAGLSEANTPEVLHFSRKREQERATPFRSSYFTLMTRPYALSPFPPSNCNSLFRRRAGREKQDMWLQSLVWSLKRILWISPFTTEEQDGIRRTEGRQGWSNPRVEPDRARERQFQ